jgi:tRNA(Ile2) C34 agmatinyltransferase TiaS
MTYLGFPTSDWRVWPRPTLDLEDDLCPECGQRRRATGDWVCARCRWKIEEERRRWAIPLTNESESL